MIQKSLAHRLGLPLVSSFYFFCSELYIFLSWVWYISNLLPMLGVMGAHAQLLLYVISCENPEPSDIQFAVQPSTHGRVTS